MGSDLHRLRVLHARAGHALAVLKDQPDPYYERLAQSIAAMLTEEEAAVVAPRIRWLLRTDFGQRDLEEELSKLRKELNESLPAATARRIDDRLNLAYIRGAVEIAPGNYTFNATDKQALRWLRSDALYWVGNYHDKDWQKRMVKRMRPAFEQGLSSTQLGRRLREAFSAELGRSEAYWQLFARNAVTRTRSFGITENLHRIGATYGVIDALLDDTTTDICRRLDGKRVLVEKMVGLRDDLVNATDPEAAKELHPWVTEPDAVDVAVAQTEAMGYAPRELSFPPYHAHCRTTVVFVDD